MTVARIFKFPKPGASTEIKVPSEVPVANPLGSLLMLFMYSKYSSTVENLGSVSGVSIDAAMVFALAAVGLVTNSDEETVNADDRLAINTETINNNIEIFRTISV